MGTYTVLVTGTYRESDGSPSFYWKSGTVIPLAQAVAFNMTGAAAQLAREQWEERKYDNATLEDVSLEPVAYSDFRLAANGVPVVADTGQTWAHAGEDSLEVISGKLTNNDATGASTGYAVLDLGAPVTRIGARFTMGARSTDGGAVAIVVWQTAMGVVIPNSPMHLSIGYHSMTLGVWTSPLTLTTIAASVIFPSDLVVDREYTVDVTIRGDTVEVLLSNGATVTGSHAKVAQFAGSFACWEVIQNDAATDAKGKFIEVWADTAPLSDTSDRSRQLTKYDVAILAPRTISNMYDPVGWNAITLGASTAAPAALNIQTVYPPSGRILVESGFWLVTNASATVLWYVGATPAQMVCSATAMNQYIHPMYISSGTPGAAVTFTFAWALSGGGATGSIYVQGDGALRITTKATPL